MRLLFLTPAYPPFAGGGERYVQALARTLSRRGHQLTIITSTATAESDYWQTGASGRENTQTDGPITVIRCPLRPAVGARTTLIARRRLMAALSLLPIRPVGWLHRLARAFPPFVGLETVLAHTSPPDLIHAFNLSWEYPALAGWRYARLHGVPYLLTPYAHVGPGANPAIVRYVTMPHQRRLLAHADAVLTLTKMTAEGLRQRGIVCRRTLVLGGGIDPPRPTLGRDALAQFQLSPPFALFVGRANVDKGALDAARATLRVRRQGGDVHLVLVGTATPEFTRFFSRLSAADQAAIRHLGLVSEAEKHALLEACAMLLLPSRTDALGIVLLEAWQHARPVVGARAGGIPGVIDEGENGLLVDYGDVPALAAAIAYLLAQPELAAAFGRAGQQKTATIYTWENVARRAEAAYALVRE